MDCYDRVGERARLLNSIKGAENICLVTGKSGVGKSHIIDSVLETEYGANKILKYEFGRNPASLTQYLLACALHLLPTRSKLLYAIKSLRISQLNLSIPFIGKAPITWGSERSTLTGNNIPLKDIVLSTEGPLYDEERRNISKIAKLLVNTEIRAIWLSNVETVSRNEFGVICLVVKHISPKSLVIIEGAFDGVDLHKVTAQVELVANKNALLMSRHNIHPFNENFARGFFDHLGLAEKGAVFNFKNNMGFPVAIKFDLDENIKNYATGARINHCLKDEDTEKTLLLLTLFYSIENRYLEIIKLAGDFGVELSLSSLIENNIAKVSETICELAHPKVARYLSLTMRQELFRLVQKQYRQKKNKVSVTTDLAAIAFSEMMSAGNRLSLYARAIDYTLDELSENRLHSCDYILTFIELGLDSLSSAARPEMDLLEKKASLLRLQIDSLLCRRTTVLANPRKNSIVDILLSAQVRMRLIDLKGAIALTLAAEAKLEVSDLSEVYEFWLRFCAQYIRLSCLIALGRFNQYEQEYRTLAGIIAGHNVKYAVLFSLLPKYGKVILPDERAVIVDEVFLAARANNNYACSLLISDCKGTEIGEMLLEAINDVSEEGSIEVTFPMNNYGVFLLFNDQIDAAIDIYFDMIDYCIYPYDYFSAYNNLAIALASRGLISSAHEYAKKAHGYIVRFELNDPVFKIKSYFNYAVLSYMNGDKKAWKEFSTANLGLTELPERYDKLLEYKVKKVEIELGSEGFLNRFDGNNVELAHALWPQNLQFWDFMYPILSKLNIEEAVSNYNDLV